MENTYNIDYNVQLQQQHQQQQQLNEQKRLEQQHQQQQQQQFCLRWHNHQTSLLSTLPMLLDQCQLTDVTISAEGRTLRAHRVVLSACSSFFLEIFRTLEANNHPVIIIPGASFAAIVALLTFMYSGEVNVYQEQIPVLLNLAETLGIKGLTDENNDLQKFSKSDADLHHSPVKEEIKQTPKSPPSPTNKFSKSVATPLFNSIVNTNLNLSTVNPFSNPLPNRCQMSSLENFVLKYLQFYPNLLSQSLNYPANILTKSTNELLANLKQYNLYTSSTGEPVKDMPQFINSDNYLKGAKVPCSPDNKANVNLDFNQNKILHSPLTPTPATTPSPTNLKTSLKDTKCFSEIVESLKSTVNSQQKRLSNSGGHLAAHAIKRNELEALNSSPIKTETPLLSITSSVNGNVDNSSSNANGNGNCNSAKCSKGLRNYNTSSDTVVNAQQNIDVYNDGTSTNVNTAANSSKCDTKPLVSITGQHVITPPVNKSTANSKLYATCFVCHKQLSNQYNLRVHLETHQNVRYSCNICSHISRSKDALRKHVSYRHPGTPSSCESETRRKRTAKLFSQMPVAARQNDALALNSKYPLTHLGCSFMSTNNSNNSVTCTPTDTGANGNSCTIEDGLNSSEKQLTAAAHLSSTYMLLPNEYHLAAIAATATQQQTKFLGHDNNINTVNSTTSATLTDIPKLSNQSRKPSDTSALNSTSNTSSREPVKSP